MKLLLLVRTLFSCVLLYAAVHLRDSANSMYISHSSVDRSCGRGGLGSRDEHEDEGEGGASDATIQLQEMMARRGKSSSSAGTGGTRRGLGDVSYSSAV